MYLQKMDKSCLFCDIMERRVQASIVYEDDRSIAFMDIQPVNPGHVLIVPKVHAQHIENLDLEIAGHLFQTTLRVAAGVRKSGVQCDAITFLLADGEVAGQEVHHVHFHVIPRFPIDGFTMKFGPHYGTQPPREELQRLADKIQAEMPPLPVVG